jgi:hypothetical protein
MFGTGWNTGSQMQQPVTRPSMPTPAPQGRRLTPGVKPKAPMATPAFSPMIEPASPGNSMFGKAPMTTPQMGGDTSFLSMFGGNKSQAAPDVPVAGTPVYSMPYTAPSPATPASVPGSVSGAQTHHNMYAGANRGQVRTNPETGQQEILMGAGGGDQYSWQAYDPNNWGQRQNADMFGRYGSNWTSGSGATSMHGSDIAQVLRDRLGREPAWQETYDIYYGVNQGQQGIAYNGGSNFVPSGGG